MTFSEKYCPLFELLKYEHPEVEIVLISGGRDSGKTFATGCFIAAATGFYNHRVLYTRYTMTSTNNSITKALDNRLELMDLSDEFNFANSDYSHKTSKGLISVTGQKTSSGDQTAKLKSLEDYSIFVTEEGEELMSYDEWEKIKRSIRANDVRCLSIIVFNPPTKDHWLYPQFYQSVPDGFNGVIGNVMYIHTTYKDNGKDNMAVHNWNEYERLRLVYEYWLLNLAITDKKIIKEAKNYKNTILGAFRDIAEGVIFDYEIGTFNPDNLPTTFGMDFGFVDPITLVEVAIDNKRNIAYVRQHLYKSGILAEDAYELIKDIVGLKLILADAQKIDDIARLQILGLNIEKCFKGGGLNGSSILPGIKAMKNFDIVVDSESTELIHEFNNYCWDIRKVETPKAGNDHCFVGSTMISTIQGFKRIDLITTNDYVYTTNGLKKVIKTFDNGIKKTIEYLIQFDTFALSLQCTDNHKIKTTIGWVKIKNLTEKHIVYIRESDIYQEEIKECTELYGHTTMVKYQMDFTYIIKMVNVKIIVLIISSLLKVKNIFLNIQKNITKIIKKRLNKTLIYKDQKQKNGTLQKMELNGIDNMQSIKILETLLLEKEAVLFAQKNTKLKTLINLFVQTIVKANIEDYQELIMKKENVLHVQKNLKSINILNKKIVTVRAEAYTNEKVYDLMIEDTHEYFANGILVHNCIDAVRYVIYDNEINKNSSLCLG